MSSITSSTSASASTSPNHLIIVCCHAIYTGGSAEDESNWLLEPFQRGETATYLAHIEAGVRELSRDKEHAILVFSGGATKRDRTDRSEGEGYLYSVKSFPRRREGQAPWVPLESSSSKAKQSKASDV
ncbi:hypothetical protein LTR67_004112 [Exophiala xenobiotica]